MNRSVVESPPLWTVVKPRPHALVRLFCCPYAGGNAAIYRPWAIDLPDSIEVRALQPPGHAGRIAETLFTDLLAFVAAAGPQTVGLLDRPFALFGHSLGAIVAFELARWLRRHQRVRPEHLFVSGRRAPQFPETDEPNYSKNDADLIASLHEMNGTPPEVLENAELLGLMLPMLRADFEMIETYAYVADQPLGCPITVFSGATDPETQPEWVDAWRIHTTSRFAAHTLPGDHFFINTHRPDLLELLRTELKQTLDANPLLARQSALRAPSRS
jgi:medium-chain acyl-[acyl-carrier-protein] hydrolase